MTMAINLVDVNFLVMAAILGVYWPRQLLRVYQIQEFMADIVNVNVSGMKTP